MAKGPIITAAVRLLISEIYIAHPDWRAKEVQCEVDKRLHGKGPGLSAVQKELAEIRKRDEDRSPESKGLDRPWSLASLVIKSEYELPPEVIPIVLEAKRQRSLDIKQSLSAEAAKRIVHIRHIVEDIRTPRSQWFLKSLDEPIQPFSVREAKWIARIYHVLKDRETPEAIGRWAHHYAEYEKACELAGVTCNTSCVDIGLLIGDYGAYLQWTIEEAMSDISYGQKEAHDIERNVFGHTLKDIELTPLGWTLYHLWLSSIVSSAQKWPNLSTKEREDVVKRLRAWVLEQEPVEELRHPEELLKEVQYSKLF